MANREALNELQARLAQRLMAAEAGGVRASWLAVRTGAQNYLFPLGLAGEICALSGLQAVPYAKPWFLGVQNVRGNLLGVVDLAAFLGQGHAAAAGQGALERCVVTLNAQLEVNCGLLVDGLLGLRSDADFTQSEPATAGAAAYLGRRFTDAEGAVWQEVDLRALAQSAAFLTISL